MICRVPAKDGPRIANDINKYMVALLDAAGNRGWLPPETMSKAEWLKIKENPDVYLDELVAFAATGPTFGGTWFGTFALQQAGDIESGDVKYTQARNALIRDVFGLQGIKFYCEDYIVFAQRIPSESIIYCDPPYSASYGYEGAKVDIEVGDSLSKNVWNTNKFWRWADSMVDAGHRVYVSEYTDPPPAIYGGGTPELRAGRAAAAERFRVLQQDSKSTREDREYAAAAIKAVEARIKANAERQAAKWASLWEKEVVSDFHSEREAGVKEGKREIEKLFHRAP